MWIASYEGLVRQELCLWSFGGGRNYVDKALGEMCVNCPNDDEHIKGLAYHIFKTPFFIVVI
jgi:hypothetical protein